MKYKVGDIVKLRDDLDLYTNYGYGWSCNSNMLELKGQKVTITRAWKNYYDIAEDDGKWGWTDGMIEGLWEECKGIAYEPYEEKTNKLKLIDVLNKITNGELKEGTKVKIDEYIYDVEIFSPITPLDKEFLNTEVELIEPQEPTECEHEWKNYEIHRIGEGLTRKYRRCEKCRLEENIEPTDNTKIEELKQLDMDFAEIDFASHEEYAICSIQVLAREMIKQIDKLNEVIRKINKEE